MMKNQPLMKWSGSKRSQAEYISSRIPSGYDTYYEPFCGGASILFHLLRTRRKDFRRFVASDRNSDLIATYRKVIDNPKEIVSAYRNHYNNISSMKTTERKQYFNEVREKFNAERNPCDFFWIMRTATNGMPRYNLNGNFNNSFHVTRIGMNPDTIDRIVSEYHSLLNSSNVVFECRSYEEVLPGENDFVYMDPPYANTNGMYFGSIDNSAFFGYVRNLCCDWLVSFNGISGEDDNTYSVPSDLYTFHEYVNSGNSSFRRITGHDRNCVVKESLYGKIGKVFENGLVF